jgi:phage baseplate assembly protein W
MINGLYRLYPKKTNVGIDLFASVDRDAIFNSIKNIILTPKGSRVYNPEFGTNIHMAIFEKNTEATKNFIESEIEEAISKFEPRVVLDNILIEDDPFDPSKLKVTLYVTYVDFNINDTFTFNLYLNN